MDQCNGKAASIHVSKPTKSPMTDNLSWLVYKVSATRGHEEGNRLIATCLTVDNDKEFLFFMTGMNERSAGNLSKSLDAFNAACRINAQNAVTYREIGKTLYEMHRFQAALDAFRRAETTMQRIDSEVYFYIAEILKRRLAADPGVFKDVVEYYKLAIMNGKHRQSYISLAELHERQNDFGKATELYESCTLVSNKTTDILLRMGLTYLKMRENQRAFEKLLDVTYIDDQQKDSLLALGGILQARQDPDGALRRYRRIALEQNEAAAQLWSNIGFCFHQKRKVIAAIANLRKAVGQAPMNFSITLNLGLVLMKSGQFATAFQVLAASVNFESNNAICYTLLGVCLVHLGDLVNADLAFEQSLLFLSLHPVGEAKILVNAAIFNYHIGKMEKAMALLRKYFDVTEGHGVGSEEAKVVQRLSHELKTGHEFS